MTCCLFPGICNPNVSIDVYHYCHSSTQFTNLWIQLYICPSLINYSWLSHTFITLFRNKTRQSISFYQIFLLLLAVWIGICGSGLVTWFVKKAEEQWEDRFEFELIRLLIRCWSSFYHFSQVSLYFLHGLYLNWESTST